MKKLLPFCLLIFFALSAFGQSINSYKRLIELNKYWEGKETTIKLAQPIENYSETELIQFHLYSIVNYLSENEPRNLKKKQLKYRGLLIKELKAYAQEAVFPINTMHNNRTPYFIDDFGTACAVGNLIIKSGEQCLAEKISKDHNYLFLENMPQKDLLAWGNSYGFTIDELKWIQPAYGPSCQPGEVRQPECSDTPMRSTGCFNPDWQRDSLVAPVTYLTEYNDGTGWVVDSFNVWQWHGAAPGQYKITITDSLNTSKLYNYNIVAPPPILSNDSVVRNASSNTFCDGKLSVNPVNGLAPYSITLLDQNNTFYQTNTTGTFDSLCADIYTIIIYDSLRCQTVDSAQIQVTTGINTIDLNNELIIANPITNSMVWSSKNPQKGKIYFFDVRGKLSYQSELNGQNVINTSSLRNGIYILQLELEDQFFRQKIIKTN